MTALLSETPALIMPSFYQHPHAFVSISISTTLTLGTFKGILYCLKLDVTERFVIVAFDFHLKCIVKAEDRCPNVIGIGSCDTRFSLQCASLGVDLIPHC